MTLKVRFHHDADGEARAIVEWYDGRAEGLGSLFVEELRTAIAHVIEGPESFPRNRNEPRTRRALLRRFPFAVVYIVAKTEILVLAVSHLRRKPGYWRERVEE